MNQVNEYNQSWLGRIWLMLKMDFHIYKRGGLICIGLILLFFNLIGRLGSFFEFDLTTSTFLTMNVWARFSLIGIPLLIIYAYYINRRVQHAQGIAFVLLPSNLFEKVLSLISGVICIMVTAWISCYASILIDGILAPSRVNLSISFAIPYWFKISSWQEALACFASMLMVISFPLCMFNALIQYKSLVKSLFIGTFIYVLFTFLLIVIATNIIEALDSKRVIEEIIQEIIENNNLELADILYIPILFFLAIDLFLGYRINKNLRSLTV